MTNALRKAPQHTAVGFKQTVSGCLIIVGAVGGFEKYWTAPHCMLRQQKQKLGRIWVSQQLAGFMAFPVVMGNLLP